MSSSIYNHKHLQPTGASTQGPSQQQHTQARLNECFDTIRAEFDVVAQELGVLRGQRDDLDNKVTGQVNELNIIRQSLYELETSHGKIRQQYEDEIRALRQELQALRHQGRERETLGLASLGRDRERERDRERDRDRDRDRERDRDIGMGPGMRGEALGRDALGLGRPSMGVSTGPTPGPGGEGMGALALTPHAGPVGLGVGAGPGSGGGAGYVDPFYGGRDRDRERDRERERERAAERGDRERDRERDTRDVKRIKTERMKPDRPGDPFSPSQNPLPHHHPHQSITLGSSIPSSGPNANGLTASTPTTSPNVSTNPNAITNANGSTSSANLNGPGTNNGLLSATPKLPPTPGVGIATGVSLPPPPYAGQSQSAGVVQQNQQPGQEGQNAQASTNGSAPSSTSVIDHSSGGPTSAPVDLSLDPVNVPSELKKEGTDWFAVFNPHAAKDTAGGKKRALDVALLHNLSHESVVCCVRFSADGKYLATGCNRTAQIYDTKTGQKTCVLVDEAASKTGDLYIRSVCFSPDGKLLATGAEDKLIRIWDIAKKRIRTVYDGHQQEIYSLDFSRDGRLIVSGSGDKTARIWDMADGSTSKILTINEPDSIDAGVTSVCISPDGRLVAAGSLDTIVRIWDVQTGALVERLKGHRDSVYSVAFTPDGKGLVSGSLDKTLKYWDVRPILRRDSSAGAVITQSSAKNGIKDGGDKGSQCTMNFTGHKDYVLSVAVSHDGQWIVSGSKDRGVQFWDAKTAVVQCMLQGHKNSVISIDLSPAGSILATGSGDWQARIWSYTAL
ncbi:hypothetical protein SCP_0508200 [Sparassis crispa]|uniref:Transcriptional repressor Tup1 N-terminal domain-containing protein n=1 Tax=Sparassis crispa TaxID=139825 RepID=A0A401GPS8_9APHY|nr:hypothetical protein SCP_0508200 [Sparassis crispa]GBE83764.1 hypothetical protein SCP_0508200 [Sparassis crispa]